MRIMTRVAWNKGKTGIYSEKTRQRWSKIRKGRRPSQEHMKKILASRKITNQKKTEELWNRRCYNDPSHKPFIHKYNGNPSWFKHPDIDGEFLCGICNYHAKKNLKFSNKEERYKAQSKFMQENNPMYNKESKKKLSETKTGVPIGPVHTEEFKEKQRLRWTGNGNPNYGGMAPERGEALSKIMKGMYASGQRKPSVQKKGPDNPLWRVERPEHVRRAISEGLTGLKRTMKTRKKIKAKRALQTNFGQPGGKNKWELLIAFLLDELGIPYRRNLAMLKGTPDFVVEPNLAIFCDGDHPHANPNEHRLKSKFKTHPGYKPNELVGLRNKLAKNIREYDQSVTEELERIGFMVKRFWNSDIDWETEYVVKEIIICLKSLGYKFK